jgi:HrpA-like RNA helicase
VSDERKSVLGHEVGYSIRFDDHTSSVTRLKYMTDGILVRECLDDPILSRYSIIMLDEAHERSIHTDILFGLVKKACSLRTDLKVLITSATLDYDKFSKYFDNCPVINIPGRIYPVDIFHSKMMQVMTPTGPSNKSYVQAAVEIVMKIHMKEDDGHILVFLTGQDEIENACHLIRQSFQSLLNKLQSVQGDLDTYRPLIILPLFSAQNTDLQRKVFQKAEACLNDDMMMNNTSVVKFTLKPRKCVVATNIAETSVTIPNIRYVVDSGFVKQKTFDPIRRIESLIIVPISQVAAQQRAGRAGRTGMIYSVGNWHAMNSFILRPWSVLQIVFVREFSKYATRYRSV